MRSFLACIVVLACAVAAHADAQLTGTGWSWFCVGNCARSYAGNPRAGFVLMGGGVDTNDAFAWQIRRAGGGDFLIIRTSGTDAYNPFVYNISMNNGGINSVSTIIITGRDGSNDPFVVEKIRNASALFIAGGDQSTYISFWQYSGVHSAIQYLIDKGVTIGGTSAGLAVLPQWTYTAQCGQSALSKDALQDPFNPSISLGTGFLHIPVLRNTITDMHFFQRDRMGRTIAFMSRMSEANDVPNRVASAIAVSEQTALLIDENGMGTVASNIKDDPQHGVYLMRTTQPPKQCESGKPLAISSVSVSRGLSGAVFNVSSFTGIFKTVHYALDVSNGVITSHGNGGSVY